MPQFDKPLKAARLKIVTRLKELAELFIVLGACAPVAFTVISVRFNEFCENKPVVPGRGRERRAPEPAGLIDAWAAFFSLFIRI